LVGACLIPGCGDDGGGPFASGDPEGTETWPATVSLDAAETSPPRRGPPGKMSEGTTTELMPEAPTPEAGEESAMPRSDLEADPPREDPGGDPLVCCPAQQSGAWASTGRVAVAREPGDGGLDARGSGWRYAGVLPGPSKCCVGLHRARGGCLRGRRRLSRRAVRPGLPSRNGARARFGVRVCRLYPRVFRERDRRRQPRRQFSRWGVPCIV